MLTVFISMLDTDEEKDKLTRIYEKYYGTMLGVAKSILTDHALAEDAVSDAVMEVVKNLHKIDDVSCHKTRAYIVIIVRSRSINLLNKRKVHEEEPIENYEIPDDNAYTFNNLTAKESCENIITHIKALSKPLSDVLYLSVIMGYSSKEISDLLKISNDAVRQRLSRAKAQLKIKLTQEGIDYGEK